MSNFEQIVARPPATWTEPNHIQCPCRVLEKEIVDDDRAIGSEAEAKGAAKEVPSLALALFPRPELLVVGDSWLASDGNSDRTDKVPNIVDLGKDLTGEK